MGLGRIRNRIRTSCVILALAALGVWALPTPAATILLNESAVHVGVSSSDGGSLTTTTGAIQNTMGTGSRKVWTYFTSNHAAPDGNQPHNAVTQVGVGDSLTASINFVLPNGATSAGTGKDFRFGLFHDPTNARLQTDTNSDSGGGAWDDALGYTVNFPLNATSSGATPIQVGKRTSNASPNLNATSAAYTFAPSGGTAFSVAASTTYTAKVTLNRVSASQLDVTASVLQGTTVLSTVTVSDTGTAFGGTAIVGTLPGNNVPYSNFDHLFWRMSSNVEASHINLTNFFVEYNPIPEPASLGLLSLAMVAFARRRRA
jgi:hypothetical protein